MKTTLGPGIAGTRSLTVDCARTIDFLGEELRVYATPELVRDFEITCRELLLKHCDPGEDSVGTGITLTHSGATLLGMSVYMTVQVTEVNGQIHGSIVAHGQLLLPQLRRGESRGEC